MKQPTMEVELSLSERAEASATPQSAAEGHGGPHRPTRAGSPTRLMARAIKFQDMIDRGEIRDYAELARLGHVSRARITQIMNLLNLAPDIRRRSCYRLNCRAHQLVKLLKVASEV